MADQLHGSAQEHALGVGLALRVSAFQRQSVASNGQLLAAQALTLQDELTHRAEAVVCERDGRTLARVSDSQLQRHGLTRAQAAAAG
jgi:hypothetical protein